VIRAMIFDLDGTLVQTERLKAISYARAVLDLRPREISEEEVVEAFKEVVGLSRRKVSLALLERFELEKAARARMTEFRVDTPWQAFVQVRLRHYEAMLADPQVLRRSQWPHSLELLQEARRAACKVGLATMSYCSQVQRVLEILQLTDAFDIVASRDDVEYGKPDPEIYLLAARELAVPSADCLVIEDSPTGVKAALAAGMWCIAVTTPFTHKAIHAGRLLDECWIVDDPVTLRTVVQQMMAERRETHAENERTCLL
jgi:beta-phosphoglucomutase